MAVLPPDPIFCLRNNMEYVHHMCFDNNDNDYTENLYAATESGFVYIWDLNVRLNLVIIINYLIPLSIGNVFVEESSEIQTKPG